jgi:threonine dehydratase
MLTLADVGAARARIAGRLPQTPLIPSRFCSTLLGCRVSLKLELFQKTGSFKPRGAFNKMLSLSHEQRQQGVVAVSGGNHAQAVAYAAGQLGCPATIYMARSTPANYLEATRAYGAEIVLCEDIQQAFKRAADAPGEMIHPFDDPLIAAGQGTVGLEILEQAPDLTHLFVSIGGGGLITGIATAVKATHPAVEIIGVETAGADAMAQSLAAGKMVEIPAITSIARTLGAPAPSAMTLEAVQRLVREVKVVHDAEAFAALVLLLERAKILTEPAASCTLAAAQQYTYQTNDHVILLLCGGNVALSDICTWRETFR